MEAASGTVMAAALETAGYRAQATLLSDLGMLLNELGALFYIAALIAAVFIVVMFGLYREGLWFFVGPALFFFMVAERTNANGAEWQFGPLEGEQSEVEEIVGEISQSNVSRFFHAYNTLISSVVQGGIGVVTDDSVRRPLIFMTRQRALDTMLRAKLNNAGLMSVIEYGITGACYDEMHAARLIALGNRDPNFRGTAEYIDAWNRYAQSARPRVSIPAESPAYDYLSDLFTAIAGLQVQGGSDPTSSKYFDLFCVGGPEVPEGTTLPTPPDRDPYEWELTADQAAGNFNFLTYSPQYVLSHPANCQQLWCWMGLGLAQEAGYLMKDTEDQLLRDYSRERYQNDTKKRYPDLETEMWHHVAVKLSDRLQFKRDKYNNPVDITTGNPPDVSVIPVVVGGILLRKAMVEDPRSQMFSALTRHSGVENKPYNFHWSDLTVEQQIDVAKRMNLHTMAQSMKYEVFTLGLMMPYLQGVFLYALSLFFPFFALLLLIPSKASAFLSWLFLWLWVKSWDLGYAFVMVADETLWSLMPHNSMYDPWADSNHGPITVFESAFAGDPAYSMASYYMLVGIMLLGVPLVTAQFLMGTRAAIAATLLAGVKDSANTIASPPAAYFAHINTYRLNLFKHLGRVQWAMKRAHNYSGELKKLHDEWQATQKKADSQKLWGTLLAVGGLIVGGALVLSGVGGIAGGALIVKSGAVLTGLGVGGAMVGSGVKQWESGKNLAIRKNAALARIMRANISKQMFYSNFTPGFRNMEVIRSAVSDRGEFWNMYDSPTALPGYLLQERTTLNETVGFADGAYRGAHARWMWDAAWSAATGGRNLLAP